MKAVLLTWEPGLGIGSARSSGALALKALTVCSLGAPVSTDHWGVRCSLIRAFGFAKEAEWLESEFQNCVRSVVTSLSGLPYSLSLGLVRQAREGTTRRFPDTWCSSTLLNAYHRSRLVPAPACFKIQAKLRVALRALLLASLLLPASGIHLPLFTPHRLFSALDTRFLLYSPVPVPFST